MKKGIINIVLIVISMFMININVYAANAGSSAAGTTLYNELKSNYDKNKSYISLTGVAILCTSYSISESNKVFLLNCSANILFFFLDNS